MVNADNEWKSLVRVTLRDVDGANEEMDLPFARVAIERGTRQVAAGAALRVAAAGAALAVAAVIGAYQWAQAEMDETAIAVLQQGVPWNP